MVRAAGQPHPGAHANGTGTQERVSALHAVSLRRAPAASLVNTGGEKVNFETYVDHIPEGTRRGLFMKDADTREMPC